MNTVDYHLSELKIAQTPNDPRHLLPRLPERFDSILDIGCGAGQTLLVCDLPQTAFVCGLDIDREALSLGRRLSPKVNLVLGSGERLPFPDASFEVAISRVALPFMHIPAVLRELARVVRPGGYVWLSLHSPALCWRYAINALKSGSPKQILYQLYVLANGLYFHLSGNQFRFPLKRSRCESFQTVRSISRALARNGFHQIEVENGKFFVVTAVKKHVPSEQ